MKFLKSFIVILLITVPTVCLAAFAIFQTYSSPIVDMGGGPNLLERSLFSSDTPTLSYSSWYVPGNGSPAISTSDYYLMSGIYGTRPYDLDAMGSEGATVKAREGGMRYVWVMWGDHPLGQMMGAGDLYVGYSNDPQVWPEPTTMRMIYRQQNSITVVDQNGYTQNSFYAYQYPYLVYNPDDGVNKFYIYAEGWSESNQRQHELTLLKSSDLLTATVIEPVIPTTDFNGWTSFGNVQRLGVNDWVTYSFGHLDNIPAPDTPCFYKYTSTDGVAWAPDYSQKVGWPVCGGGHEAGQGPYFTISGQQYLLMREQDTVGVKDYLSLLAVDANKVSQGTFTRISTAFGTSDGFGSVYPWQTYMQSSPSAYEEDGVVSIYLSRGYFSNNVLNNGPYRGFAQSWFDITGSITSTVLTISAISGGTMAANQVIYTQFLGTLAGNATIVAQLTGTGGATCPDPTCVGTTGTYSTVNAGNQSSQSLKVAANGGLWNQFIDQYYLITDATAAASAAPLGVKASCAAGVATVQWNNSLPHQNYRIYKGTSAATQATLVGDVTGTSITDTPTADAQTWYKVVTMNVTEQKNRVVNVYCSANTAMVNKHVNRILNDGGSGYDVTFIATADTWLTSNNAYRYVQWWTDVRFGYKLDGSGFISKIYDLGTTYLPRGGDYTPTTSNTWPSTSSNTSYSATSFRGTTPSWINNAASAHGYFGNGRANILQRWNEISLLVAYQKPNTNAISLFGMNQNGAGLSLQHASGSSGNVSFVMGASSLPPASTITATAAFAVGATAHVSAGVFDGSTLTAYHDGVAGTPVDASAYANPTMLVQNTALFGARPSSYQTTAQVLCAGVITCYQTMLTRAYTMETTLALYTGAGMAVFNKGISAAQVASWGALYN